MVNRKKTILVLAILVCILSVLSGCGTRKITSGEVVEKTFTEAHTETRLIPICISNGKSIITILRPYIYHYSDRFEITIQKWNEEKSEMETATYRVTKAVYNSVEIGYEFVYENDMCPQEPEYTREKQNT